MNTCGYSGCGSSRPSPISAARVQQPAVDMANLSTSTPQCCQKKLRNNKNIVYPKVIWFIFIFVATNILGSASNKGKGRPL